MACGEMSNVIVVRVNKTQFEDVAVQFIGKDLTPTDLPGLVSSATGYKDYAFFAPVIQSTTVPLQNAKQLTLVLDPDNTYDPDGGISNITMTYYDSAVFYNDDVADHIKCGVEDEDDSEIGAAAADTLNIPLDDD